MHSKKIILGLFVWLASVGVAYYVGQKLNDVGPGPAVSTNTAIPSVPSSVAGRSNTLAPSSPSAAADSLMKLSQENLDEALRQADELNENDQRALLAEAFALPANDYRRARMLRTLLSQLAETAPLDALAMAKEIGSLRETERARVDILQIWAKKDPVAALAWAKVELANAPLRSQSSQLLAIYRGYAANNPQAAFADALAMPTANSGEQRIQSSALEVILQEQIENGGLLEAKLQVESLEEGGMKNRLLSELVDQWASFDPTGAAAYVNSLSAELAASLAPRLVGEWAENDPEGAAAWLSAQELDENTLSRASTAIIREWTRYDLAASAEWLNSQPSSPALDRAVMSYTYRAAQEDPASAMTWAESIDNDWMRTRMMQHVAANWREEDQESFQSYLNSSEFDEAQKKQLEEARPFRGRGRGWR
ncbi:MAG: hypothetical protein ACNA77_05675 [Opitutales bacterium]